MKATTWRWSSFLYERTVTWSFAMFIIKMHPRQKPNLATFPRSQLKHCGGIASTRGLFLLHVMACTVKLGAKLSDKAHPLIREHLLVTDNRSLWQWCQGTRQEVRVWKVCALSRGLLCPSLNFRVQKRDHKDLLMEDQEGQGTDALCTGKVSEEGDQKVDLQQTYLPFTSKLFNLASLNSSNSFLKHSPDALFRHAEESWKPTEETIVPHHDNWLPKQPLQKLYSCGDILKVSWLFCT